MGRTHAIGFLLKHLACVVLCVSKGGSLSVICRTCCFGNIQGNIKCTCCVMHNLEQEGEFSPLLKQLQLTPYEVPNAPGVISTGCSSSYPRKAAGPVIPRVHLRNAKLLDGRHGVGVEGAHHLIGSKGYLRR